MTDFSTRRTMMVDTQVRPSDVTKFPIIDAMLTVAREDFVPTAQREAAYVGENLALGEGRVLLEPRTLAKMLDVLAIDADELVLDLGCAFGYSSAVIARMAQAVVAVEQDADMARDAQDALVAAGADNAVVHQGPLIDGAALHGPYDVIGRAAQRGRTDCCYLYERAVGRSARWIQTGRADELAFGV